MSETRRDSDEHLSAEQLSGLVGGTLTLDETAAAQNHLVRCSACRDEAMRASELIRGYRRKSFWRIGLPIAAAAAAVILFAVLPLDSPPPETAVLRSTESVVEREGMASIAIVGPSSSHPVDADDATFTWRSVPDEATYVLTLTGEDGVSIWSTTTTDTTIALPDSVELRTGETYLWYVDAMLVSGRTASTGVRRFRTRP